MQDGRRDQVISPLAQRPFLALCHIGRERRGGWGGVEPGSPTGEKTWRRRERGGEGRLSTRCTYLDVCPSAIPNEGGWVVGGGDGGGGGGGGRGVAGGGGGGGGGRAGATAGCGPERVRGGRQRGAAVAVRCVLRLQQQCSSSAVCSVQCSTAGAGTETGGRHGCDAVAMHASRYADVMQQKRRRAVVVFPGLGDGLSAAAGCRCWLLAATATS